jgi:hypothetical protein
MSRERLTARRRTPSCFCPVASLLEAAELEDLIARIVLQRLSFTNECIRESLAVVCIRWKHADEAHSSANCSAHLLSSPCQSAVGGACHWPAMLRLQHPSTHPEDVWCKVHSSLWTYAIRIYSYFTSLIRKNSNDLNTICRYRGA